MFRGVRGLSSKCFILPPISEPAYYSLKGI